MGCALLPASSPLVGSAQSPMMQAVDDTERQRPANQLCGLLIRDAPAADAQAALKPHGSPAPAVKNAAPADVPTAHGAYYGYNLGRRVPRSIMNFINLPGRVNGSLLWVIEISDKPGQRETEPAFKVSDSSIPVGPKWLQECVPFDGGLYTWFKFGLPAVEAEE